MTNLSAGWAQADITPPVGIHLGGYWGRRSGAVAIHDRLDARVIVWCAPSGDGVALVALDLVGLTAPAAMALRVAVARAMSAHVPAAPEAVMVCCTHTHSGPLSLPFRGMGEVDEGYLDLVRVRAAGAAQQAAARLRPVEMASARAPVKLGVNRRQGRPGKVRIGADPDGPVAPHAQVLVLTGPDGRAILFQHACHPVVLGRANHEISADFPGVARRVVEAQTGATAVYVNGAAGDLNPVVTGGTFEDVDRLGTRLGTAVSDAAGSAERTEGTGLGWRRERLELPLIDPPPASRAAIERAVQELKTAVRAAGADEWDRRVPEARLAWSRELLERARQDGAAPTQPFEVQGLRTGGVRLLGLEGEMFVRYQLQLEASEEPPPVVCGYANGCIGYVPTANEYGRGGYEVEEAYKVYPSVLMIAPESEALILAAARQVLAQLG